MLSELGPVVQESGARHVPAAHEEEEPCSPRAEQGLGEEGGEERGEDTGAGPAKTNGGVKMEPGALQLGAEISFC